ncbi:MAG TPA: transglycosylase domain-containing protein [Acidimicrobiales bacterium]|nr:transglycosylase domain-containing protein [Acidimicrobiales bacterium]
MHALRRCALTVVVAGAFLALGVLLMAPQAKALLGEWDTDAQGGLENMCELSQRSVVQRRDGSTLAVLHADENRANVKLKDVPEPVIDAVLGVEDDRYWDHHGVDMRGTLRALATNVKSGDVVQGGSTITQQLVKNCQNTPEKTVGRKVREAALAWRLEDRWSKNRILEQYLNTVYFGNGAYGVQAAAEVYFNKAVGELTMQDAVLLAGTIRNPVGYDPIKFPKAAMKRRAVVVRQLVAGGVLTERQSDRVLAAALPSKMNRPVPTEVEHFIQDVKDELLEDPRLGDTPTERYNAVFKGGLRIVTTLDPELQAEAQRAVDANLPDTNGRFAAAVASIDPTSGAVRAIVGGADFEKSKVNLATQGFRQAGSAFKTMVLVAAIEQGYGPNTHVDGSAPCKVSFPGHLPHEFDNYEGGGGGVRSITDATAHSVNCAYVRLAAQTGLDNVEDVAKRLGITSTLRDGSCDCVVPAVSLGGLYKGVSPLEMASAYATLAADGVYHKPFLIDKVLDRHGRTLIKTEPKGQQRVSAQTARVAVSILKSVVQSGTATRASLGSRPVFGKTGTSQDNADAWFVGSTRQLTTSVWMGALVGRVPMTGVPGVGRVTGGSIPAKIWGVYMRAAMQGRAVLQFPAPDPRQIENRSLSPTTRTPDTGLRTVTTIGGVEETDVSTPDVIVTPPVTDSPRNPQQPPPSRPPRSPDTTRSNCERPPDWPPDWEWDC